MKIKGGYIVIARKLLESGIFQKPPLYAKLWLWMLMQAQFKDNSGLKRGQFFTSIDLMREAMTHKVGYRISRPTKKEIRGVYDFLTKGTMTVTTKVTHGMIITICNYDEYQRVKNYEGHDEGHDEGTDRGTIYIEKECSKERKECNKEEINNVQKNRFEEFWDEYPSKVGKKPCKEKWDKRKLDQTAEKIIADVKKRKHLDKKWAGGFIPNPLTYINQDRWNDEIEKISSGESAAERTREKLERQLRG